MKEDESEEELDTEALESLAEGDENSFESDEENSTEETVQETELDEEKKPDKKKKLEEKKNFELEKKPAEWKEKESEKKPEKIVFEESEMSSKDKNDLKESSDYKKFEILKNLKAQLLKKEVVEEKSSETVLPKEINALIKSYFDKGLSKDSVFKKVLYRTNNENRKEVLELIEREYERRQNLFFSEIKIIFLIALLAFVAVIGIFFIAFVKDTTFSSEKCSIFEKISIYGEVEDKARVVEALKTIESTDCKYYSIVAADTESIQVLHFYPRYAGESALIGGTGIDNGARSIQLMIIMDPNLQNLKEKQNELSKKFMAQIIVHEACDLSNHFNNQKSDCYKIEAEFIKARDA